MEKHFIVDCGRARAERIHPLSPFQVDCHPTQLCALRGKLCANAERIFPGLERCDRRGGDGASAMYHLGMALVEVDAVSKSYPRRAGLRTEVQTVVEDVSFSIQSGGAISLAATIATGNLPMSGTVVSPVAAKAWARSRCPSASRRSNDAESFRWTAIAADAPART